MESNKSSDEPPESSEMDQDIEATPEEMANIESMDAEEIENLLADDPTEDIQTDDRTDDQTKDQQTDARTKDLQTDDQTKGQQTDDQQTEKSQTDNATSKSVDDESTPKSPENKSEITESESSKATNVVNLTEPTKEVDDKPEPMEEPPAATSVEFSKETNSEKANSESDKYFQEDGRFQNSIELVPLKDNELTSSSDDDSDVSDDEAPKVCGTNEVGPIKEEEIETPELESGESPTPIRADGDDEELMETATAEDTSIQFKPDPDENSEPTPMPSGDQKEDETKEVQTPKSDNSSEETKPAETTISKPMVEVPVEKKPAVNGASVSRSSSIDDIVEVTDTRAPTKKRRKVTIDYVCVNPDCTVSGKSNSDVTVTAKTFVLAHYGVKVEASKKRKVCHTCLKSALDTQANMLQRLKNNELIIDEKLPIPKESTVTLDDSDQEMQTDSSSESEFEFEMSVSSDDEGSPAKVKNINDVLGKLIDDEISKLNVKNQIDGAIESITRRLDSLIPEMESTDKKFNEIEKMVDEMREDLYRPFRPIPEFLPPIDLDKLPTSTTSQTNQTGSAANSSRTVNQAPKTLPRQGQLEVQTLTPTKTPMQTPNLPPHGDLQRPLLKIGDNAYAMRGSILNVWKLGLVTEIIEKEGEKQFKLRFETSNGKTKNIQTKILGLKYLAYSQESPVRLQVGTRIIGIYKEADNQVGEYYAGIVAEPPKQMNRHRYLIFFDDGYASYIHHEDIRVVCKQSDAGVWEDVHPNSREFIKKYLEQYPERPMVKLSIGQIIRTEREGSWWYTQVEEVDASLVKLLFHVNTHRESIYRGSTRLGPLYLEMQEQRKRQTGGTNKTFSRRNAGFNRNNPYVEYTRHADDDTTTQGTTGADGSSGSQDQPIKRSVARKSTTAVKRADSSLNDPNREQWDYKGTVAPVALTDRVEGIPFTKHQCSPKCLIPTEGETKYLYNEAKMKCENPLIVPIKLGWQRQLTKFNNYNRRWVYYIAPCGRRLRNLDEIHRYLRVTQSNLEIDFFNCEWFLHIMNEFKPDREFCAIPDISYGKENVPISCVNSLDKMYPEYVDYSTTRIPMKNVEINSDDGFLTCCDCTDDCQDRERCACWQLTISHTVASNKEAKVIPNVGYQFRRLMEPVTTGIFECNRNCKCKKSCLNRVAQHPLRVKLQAFKTEKRGWGIRTLCDIPRGGFICIYVGNLYSNDEANQHGQDFGDEYFAELDLIEVVERNKDGYESDVDEDEENPNDVELHSEELDGGSSTEEETESPTRGEKEVPDQPFQAKNVTIPSEASDRQTRSRNKPTKTSESAPEPTTEPENVPKYVSTRKLFGKDEDVYIMDAKLIGNVGRFLNHSCAPNVFVQNCFVDTHDLRFPWVSFFAQCHIPAGQELCWDYAYIVDQVKGKEIYCECGADCCRGRLL